jgi:hypothetical protein
MGARQGVIQHPIWSFTTLLRAWLGALGLVVLSQILSALIVPRSWEFFWLLPMSGTGRIAVSHAAISVWLGLWRQRPFEAFSVSIVLLLLTFTAAWIVVWLWRAGHHTIITRRAV